MKNILTFLVFIIFLSAGVLLDSFIVNLIVDFFTNLGFLRDKDLVIAKVGLWMILSLLTGGFIFFGVFVASGYIRTSLRQLK
jgi:hypothetical protein